MVKTTATSTTQKRKPRILWANPFCLMDTSSGASMTVRQMLMQLVAHGYDVQILGATVFDNTKGMGRLKEQFPNLSTHLHQLIEAITVTTLRRMKKGFGTASTFIYWIPLSRMLFGISVVKP